MMYIIQWLKQYQKVNIMEGKLTKKIREIINRTVDEIRLEPPVDNEVRESESLYPASKISKHWWMGPDLVLHKVPYEMHREWAINYLKRIGQKVDIDTSDVYGMMYRYGFVHIVKIEYPEGSVLHYSYSKINSLSNRQLSAIKDLAIEEKCKYVSDTNTGREEELQESTIKEGVEDLPWKAWWMDPHGGTNEISRASGHYTWAKVYLRKQGINTDQGSYELIRRGWIRITFNYYKDGALHFDHSRSIQPTEKQLSEIKNLAIENRATKMVDDNTNKDISLLQENMFPKGFNRHDAVCAMAAAHATKYFLSKGMKNFKVVEGFARLHPNDEIEDYESHVWIKFNDGRLFDPTRKQWKVLYNVNPDEVTYDEDEIWEPEDYMDYYHSGWLDRPLTENMSYEELLKLTADTPRSPDDDTNRIDRSKNVRVRSIPVSAESGLEQWNFRYKSDKLTGNPGDPLEGHIIFLKGEIDRNDDAVKLECKVDCSCPDYKYKFAYNNYAKGASDIGPDSLNNAINRRPKQAYDIGEGLCKHLSALAKYLATKVTATKKQNIFEAIGDVAKQGPFNITYYD